MIEELKTKLINFGKYKNKTYIDIINNKDIEYLKWCISHKINEYNFTIIFDYILENKNNDDQVLW